MPRRADQCRATNPQPASHWRAQTHAHAPMECRCRTSTKMISLFSTCYPTRPTSPCRPDVRPPHGPPLHRASHARPLNQRNKSLSTLPHGRLGRGSLQCKSGLRLLGQDVQQPRTGGPAYRTLGIRPVRVCRLLPRPRAIDGPRTGPPFAMKTKKYNHNKELHND